MPGDNRVEAELPPNQSTDALASLPATELLAQLERSGIEVRAKDDKLQINAPAGALTPELQAELRRRKPELLALLAGDASEEDAWAPLTFAQQRLWLIENFSPSSIEYNIPQAWLIDGAVDREALRQSIDRLADRHAALRTSIELRGGVPVQVVANRVQVPLDFTDLGSEIDAESRIDSLLREQSRQPFALDRAPLIRFHLYRLSDSRSLVSYTIHHIVADQWSLGVITRDLAAFYSEATSGNAAGLPALTIEYSDLARRESSEAAQRLYAAQLEYWRKKLTGLPPVLDLPFSNSRPLQPTSSGATLDLTLDATLTEGLRQFAARNSTSLYLLTLTVFATLLYRYSGQRDLCIGSPITGRKRSEEEHLVGLFLNMLPLRCALDPAEGFIELLKRTRASVLDDFEHSDIPFQKLVTELRPERSPAYSPFFQISFALNTKGREGFEEHDISSGTSKFDLSLLMIEQQSSLNARFEYRTDLFAAEDIEAFGRHFVQLAESILQAPEQAVGELPLLTCEDLDRLRQWNATGLPLDPEATLISLFQEQAELYPDALALCSAEAVFTYRELDERSALLAHLLREKGAAAGRFIAICLDRSPDLIVAMLAVLKTGAAYLPLDPKYPDERLAFMLEDSNAPIMITQPNDLSAKLAGRDADLKTVFVQKELAHARTNSAINRQAAAAKSIDPAYLIYTSGSTGRPKGVVVEHRNAVALIAWARSCFDPECLQGMLASTSVCFDLSIFEIFLPLATGNTVLLVQDVLELPTFPHREKVTLINTVPSAMNALLQTQLPPAVQTVCMAGEFLPTELVDRVYAAGARQVFDLYGPTETTTYSTFTLRLPGEPANIGGPIANTRLYLLDENLSQVPAGAIGEIFIGGEGVARGYLDRPELTTERFLTLPAIEPHSRLYRTGDLARLRSDGTYIYLGRRDQQVKLRGYRIELGEVESALRESTGASEVAVVVQSRPSGEILVAFVADGESKRIDPAECAAALRKRLPAYMVPALIVPIAELPRTPNGKTDRKALSQTIAADAHHKSEPPADLLEQWLANIWAARLDQKQVARNAHFFDDLGGHSLAAFEIFAEIESRIGVALGLATLFQAPSVELLAGAIRRHEWKEPRHLRLLSSGVNSKVIYVVGHPASADPQAIRNLDGRVMAIDANGRSDQLEDSLREMIRFEATKPSIVLASAPATLEEARRLATKLAHAGFSDVSLHTI